MRQMRSQLQKKEVEIQRAATPASQALAVQNLWHKDENPARLATARDETRDATKPVGTAKQHRGSAPSLWPAALPDKPFEESRDAIDKGLLTMDTARQLFETYKTELFRHYPLVHVSPLTTADEMRREKPTLFLAIIAAASAKENPELSATLDKEVLQSYALRSLVLSQKTIELVQALILSAAWYYPPQRFGQLKYYEYVCMAVSMSMDIGIGSHASPRHDFATRSSHKDRAAAQPSALHPAEDFRNPDLSMSIRQLPSSAGTATVEARRTFLACYIISVGVSMSLKRPNIIRVSSYLRECLDYLETAPNTPDTDAQLVAWGRLVIIAEEISIAFRYGDPGDTVTIADLQTQMMLKDFQARLTAWDQSVPRTCRGTGALRIMYHTARLYLFEVALHVDHSPEDFKAPYQMGVLQTVAYASAVPTKVLAEAVAECVSGAHAILEAFLEVDAESLRAFPVFSFVRISFAAFILAKLSLSTASPNSRLAQVLDQSCLQVEHYMNRAILHVRNVVGTTKGRVPSIFLALLFKLRQWCLHPMSLMESRSHTPEENVFDDVVREPDLTHRIKNEEARIIEQLSSDESSPQTIGSGNSSTNVQAPPPVVGQPSPLAGGLTAMQNMHSGLQNVQNELSHVWNLGTLPTYPDNIPASRQQLGLNHTAGSMALDNNLFAFLGDATTFPEGGLTGLDAWGDITQDLASMSNVDLMNWQFPSG
ncbi:hypothetical protein Slin14017_G006090 [Septoria linicola]|nr:hypothetical protein Slin14017_G006090 [Septoria linicola]